MPSPFPWEYLEVCSSISLHNFALSQQNIAAMLRKTIAADTDNLITALVNAEVARLIIENGEKVSRIIEIRQQALKFETNFNAGKILATNEEIELLDLGEKRKQPMRVDRLRNRMKRSA